MLKLEGIKVAIEIDNDKTISFHVESTVCNRILCGKVFLSSFK